MIQLLVWMVIKGNAFVFGGDYKIPVMHKLLDENFVDELKEDGTYNIHSFAREYESIWSGSSENSFFNADVIDKHRILTSHEIEPNKKKNKDIFYIVACDVARVQGNQNANTVAHVIKAIPRDNGIYLSHVVNTFTFSGEHFEDQAIKLKKLVFNFDARMLIVDAQGSGVGLVDFLVKQNVDEEKGEIFLPFSVTNDSDYDQFKTKDSLPLLYNVKATHSNSSQIHMNCLSKISSGKVKFLIDEMTAKTKLLSTKKGQQMSSNELADFLMPYAQTSQTREEMLNLRSNQEGKQLKLERINNGLQKDRYSALEYGLWYLKILEDKNINKGKGKVKFNDLFLFRQPKIRK